MPKVPSRWCQTAPKDVQKRPQSPPKGTKGAPKASQGVPKTSQRVPQSHPKVPPKSPKGHHREQKRRPRPSKKAQRSPECPKEGQIDAQGSPRGAQSGQKGELFHVFGGLFFTDFTILLPRRLPRFEVPACRYRFREALCVSSRPLVFRHFLCVCCERSEQQQPRGQDGESTWLMPLGRTTGGHREVIPYRFMMRGGHQVQIYDVLFWPILALCGPFWSIFVRS